MTVLEATAAAIVAAGQGTLGTDLFLQFMPDTPDLCVGVYEYQGRPPVETMGARLPVVEMPRVQVIVRGAVDDYPTARDRAVGIRAALAVISDQTFAGVVLMRLAASGTVMPMGVDEKQRPKVSANFQAWVR